MPLTEQWQGERDEPVFSCEPILRPEHVGNLSKVHIFLAHRWPNCHKPASIRLATTHTATFPVTRSNLDVRCNQRTTNT